MSKIIQKKESYLLFKLSNELFAVNAHKVLEVLEKHFVTHVPCSAEYVKGVIHFRGEVLPVIETRLKLNMKERDENLRSVIIILDLVINDDHVKIGAVADVVKDVLEISERDIKPVPQIGYNYPTEFLKGIINSENGFVMILDSDKVFSEELEIVEEDAENQFE